MAAESDYKIIIPEELYLELVKRSIRDEISPTEMMRRIFVIGLRFDQIANTPDMQIIVKEGDVYNYVVF